MREICDRIARTILEPIDEDTNLDTLERTGPGLWTDTVLKHARLHPIAKVAFTLTLPCIAILRSHCHSDSLAPGFACCQESNSEPTDLSASKQGQEQSHPDG